MSTPAPTWEARRRRQGVLLLLVAAVLWSFAGVLVKSIALSPYAIAGTRSLVALPLIALFALRRGRIRWSWSHLAGGLAYTAVVILFVLATKMTTAANAILLQYTAPVYVALFSARLVRERVRAFDWVTILIALAGMGLFFCDKLTADGMLGNLLALVSAVAFAALTLLMRRQKGIDPLGSIVLGNLLTAVICAPAVLHAVPLAHEWGLLVLMGIFQLGLSYLCFSLALERVTALEGIMIPVLEPILNPVWTFLFVGEVPGRWAIPGGLLVIAAVTTRSLHELFSAKGREGGRPGATASAPPPPRASSARS